MRPGPLDAGMHKVYQRRKKGEEPVSFQLPELEEILALPVPADIARRIYEHRVYERFYGSVYELMEVDGMTAALLEQLKPLVATIPPPVADASIARLSASFRTVQNFLGEVTNVVERNMCAAQTQRSHTC